MYIAEQLSRREEVKHYKLTDREIFKRMAIDFVQKMPDEEFDRIFGTTKIDPLVDSEDGNFHEAEERAHMNPDYIKYRIYTK